MCKPGSRADKQSDRGKAVKEKEKGDPAQRLLGGQAERETREADQVNLTLYSSVGVI